MAGAVARERRASPRVLGLAMAGMERARLRPGRTAHIVDLSAGGALIETDWRLLPGMRVEMQVGEPIPCFASLAASSGVMWRCSIASASGIAARWCSKNRFPSGKRRPALEKKLPGISLLRNADWKDTQWNQ